MDPDNPSIETFALKLSKLFIVPIILFSNSSPESAKVGMLKNRAISVARNFIFQHTGLGFILQLIFCTFLSLFVFKFIDY